jgi:hypothetical protein
MGSSSSVPETRSAALTTAAASGSDIGHVRMFRSRETGHFIPLRPDDPNFAEVFWGTAAAVSLALDLLSSEQGIFALVDTTKRIRDGEVPAYVKAIKDDQILPTIRQFLALIRGNFPTILVTRLYGMHNKTGRTSKRDCYGVFRPQQAAIIEISGVVRINFLVSDPFFLLLSLFFFSFSYYFFPLFVWLIFYRSSTGY